MITATQTEVKGQMGNRIQFAVTLSDGRTMTTTAKTEKDAVKTILKHVNAAPVATEMSAGDHANLIFGTSGVWSAEFAEYVAKIAAAAKEEGNDMVASLAEKLRRTHSVSIAQAGVLGRFAWSNDINF